jgi:hypothetical protein
MVPDWAANGDVNMVADSGDLREVKGTLKVREKLS